jgi:hypothetical protein
MVFEDPSPATGTDEYILSEFRRIWNEIKKSNYTIYIKLKSLL